MNSSKLYHYFHYCLLVVASLMATDLAIHSINCHHWIEAEEFEEEASEWIEEVQLQTYYEFGDGNDNNKNHFIKTAYWKSNKLFSFLAKNDSNTIQASIVTIINGVSTKLYLLFQQLKLDCYS